MVGRGGAVPFDAIVIGAIVLINAVIGFVQEAKAEQAVAALQQMASPTARVFRGGQELEIPTDLAERRNMVFKGTAATRGRGKAVVTTTGMATEMGEIARLLGETEGDRTPLQEEVARIGRMVGQAVVVITVVVIGAILLTSSIDTVSDSAPALAMGVDPPRPMLWIVPLAA